MHTHTHTHTRVCVCVCVAFYSKYTDSVCVCVCVCAVDSLIRTPLSVYTCLFVFLRYLCQVKTSFHLRYIEWLLVSGQFSVSSSAVVVVVAVWLFPNVDNLLIGML